MAKQTFENGVFPERSVGSDTTHVAPSKKQTVDRGSSAADGQPDRLVVRSAYNSGKPPTAIL